MTASASPDHSYQIDRTLLMKLAAITVKHSNELFAAIVDELAPDDASVAASLFILAGAMQTGYSVARLPNLDIATLEINTMLGHLGLPLHMSLDRVQ
jgi:hypothetical protein